MIRNGPAPIGFSREESFGMIGISRTASQFGTVALGAFIKRRTVRASGASNRSTVANCGCMRDDKLGAATC